ncbi:MAG: hypothetical protein EZS28_015624 [Streblomastix strix]|uniref:Uncharacterized protein n=1 Tax=Streblomastix strix TaxID=222440 RepID=A0A5J4W217_9EUKA|nr:MAG: hypothetical protein EZS28_015624 [Streblomastix strix]
MADIQGFCISEESYKSGNDGKSDKFGIYCKSGESDGVKLDSEKVGDGGGLTYGAYYGDPNKLYGELDGEIKRGELSGETERGGVPGGD